MNQTSRKSSAASSSTPGQEPSSSASVREQGGESTGIDERSAIRHAASHLRLWPVAVIGLFLDLWTKHWAMTALDPDPGKGREVIPHLMSFQRSLNTGALFGLGKGLTVLFIAASVVALMFVLYLFASSTPRRRSLHIALGLILAGALGNLFDRTFMIADVFTSPANDHIVGVLVNEREDGTYVVGFWPEGEGERVFPADWEHHQQGVVRDFIRMEPRLTIAGKEIHIWPWVFNLADVWLVVGVGLLMLNFWWDRKAERAAEAAEKASAAEPAQ